MTILLATDLHFSDSPRDSYRFGLFDFLIAQRAKHKANLTLILGDLTNEKDKHSSRLVNSIVDGLVRLAAEAPVIILKGNHDYQSDPDSPFFDFLNRMKNIRFVVKPQTWITSEESKLLFLPHFSDENAWDNFRLDKRPDYAFIHQTVTGAISESGRRLDGFSLKPLKRLKCPVFGGDVHKPHEIGPVTYVGPPYHVRFGDNFVPRCLVLNEETGKTRDIHFECPRKWSITLRDPEDLKDHDYLRKGDQIKVTLELTREEITDWKNHKDLLAKSLSALGLVSYGIELKVQKAKKRKEVQDEVVAMKNRTPGEILGSFCNSEKLPRDIRKIGRKLLGE